MNDIDKRIVAVCADVLARVARGERADPYRLIAALLSGTPLDEVSDEVRARVKRDAFATAYGATSTATSTSRYWDLPFHVEQYVRGARR